MPAAYGFTAYGGPQVQRFLDLPTPVPGPGELLVEVRAAGVNPVDWKVRSGMHRTFLHLDLPAVLGREAAGTVVQLGPGVDEFAVGDPVFGSTDRGCGGYAHHALLTARRTAPKPADISWTDAAVLPVAAGTAHDAIEQLAPKPGESLLILGVGGGVGVVAAQLARQAGVLVSGTAATAKREFVESLGVTAIPYDGNDFSTRLRKTLPDGADPIPGSGDMTDTTQLAQDARAFVTGTAATAEREFVESLGATAIPYDGNDFSTRLRKTLPDGADVILDLVGGDALRSVVPVMSLGCRILTVADAETAARFGARPLSRESTTESLAGLARRVADGRLDPMVRSVFRFENAAAALRAVESGHPWGKVALDLCGDR
ncbi:NADP-dependent oxidoreductase [Streptomyces sp. NPDC002276]